jgi:hypothetical protein
LGMLFGIRDGHTTCLDTLALRELRLPPPHHDRCRGPPGCRGAAAGTAAPAPGARRGRGQPPGPHRTACRAA